MKETVRRLVADQAGNGDPWGTALRVHFAIADVLYASCEQIPSEWHYRPSPLFTEMVEELAANEDGNTEYTTEELARLYVDGEIDADDLVHAGNVLSRYVRMLDAAGLSY